MFSLSDKVPDYLLGKSQLVWNVTFAALFSLVFLLVSVPFSHNAWFKLGTSVAFGFTVAFFMIALAVVIISKTVMYKLKGRFEMLMSQYVIWNVVEIIMVCALYTAFTYFADRSGRIMLDGISLVNVFFNSLVYCAVSLGVPYIFSGMYFAINDKDNTIRLMNFGNVVSDEAISPVDEKKITLFDNNGILKLSVSSSNLYYIESDDNYIKVWYKDSKGLLKQYMLRCRLKTVEESFQDSDLMRCHRKYIVNMAHVKILSKEKDGYLLELDADKIDPIPVTKTYEESVIGRFNSR